MNLPTQLLRFLNYWRKLCIREDIYEQACEDDEFSRFTIVHELLHFFKHRQEEIVFCRTVEEMKSRKAYEDPEWQAN